MLPLTNAARAFAALFTGMSPDAGHGLDLEGQEEFRDTYARVRARDRAIAVPKPTSPEPEPQAELETEPDPVILPEIRMPPAPLPWHGAGNVVAATGCAFLALMARA